MPELFGYDLEPYYNGSLKIDRGVSFIKGGINYSDQVTTVSRSYAEEIKSSEYGEKLDGLLRSRSCYLKGIVNGIDYAEYNPSTDSHIYRNYNKKCLDNKLENKLMLQRQLGLPQRADVPMIGLVSRLTHQKGCDLIITITKRYSICNFRYRRLSIRRNI